MITAPCKTCFGINENRCYFCGKTVKHYKKIDPGKVIEIKFLYKTWCFCRDFNMVGSGAVAVDAKMRNLFGDHKKPMKRPFLIVRHT